MNGDKLVRHVIALFPKTHLKRSAVDILDNVHLTLVFRKGQTPRAVSQAPLPGVIINRKAEEFDERRSSQTLRVIFILRARSPDAREIDLRKCGNAGKQNQRQKQRDDNSGTIDEFHNKLPTKRNMTVQTRNGSTFKPRKSMPGRDYTVSSMSRRTIFPVVASAIIVVIISVPLTAQAQAPWSGTWTLDFAKSTGNSATRYKRVVLKISPWADGLKVTYDYVGIRGGVTHMEWAGKFDGKDYPVQGLDYVLTNAYTLVDNRNYRIVIKADGAVAATATVAVSPDGKRLTSVTSGENGTTTSVYERR